MEASLPLKKSNNRRLRIACSCGEFEKKELGMVAPTDMWCNAQLAMARQALEPPLELHKQPKGLLQATEGTATGLTKPCVDGEVRLGLEILGTEMPFNIPVGERGKVSC